MLTRHAGRSQPRPRNGMRSPSAYGGGYDVVAWSVARGTVLWTTRYAAAKVYSPVAIAESGDGLVRLL
jgi:hypothetical protein